MADRVLSEIILKCVPERMEKQFEVYRNLTWRYKFLYSYNKDNKMYYFSTLFGKQLYMFRTDLLSNVRSLNSVFTATGICHIGSVYCLLVRSGSSLAYSQHN